MIPVIGTAVVKNPHWVERLYKSIDYPVDTFVIFNNNGKDEITQELDNLRTLEQPFVRNLKVCHLPGNVGVGGVWNLIIKTHLMSPYWIIVNDDVSFLPGFLEEMYQAALLEDVGMVHGYGGDFDDGAWDLFLIKDWVVDTYGLFDENLYPAYCEDADYLMRLVSKPIKRITNLQTQYMHGDGFAKDYYIYGSQTRKSDNELSEKLTQVNTINFEYMTKKWGQGWRMTNPYKKPFTVLPLSYTTYDLSYVRKKYLGF